MWCILTTIHSVALIRGPQPQFIFHVWHLLREALYGAQNHLQPFEVLYKEQLKLRQQANTPDPPNKRPNFNEGKDQFKKGSLVYIDFVDDYQVSRKYNIKRGPIFEISEVNTLQRPFLYKLKDVYTDKEALGWYYGR